jgi:hypothetical protein
MDHFDKFLLCNLWHDNNVKCEGWYDQMKEADIREIPSKLFFETE